MSIFDVTDNLKTVATAGAVLLLPKRGGFSGGVEQEDGSLEGFMAKRGAQAELSAWNDYEEVRKLERDWSDEEGRLLKEQPVLGEGMEYVPVIDDEKRAERDGYLAKKRARVDEFLNERVAAASEEDRVSGNVAPFPNVAFYKNRKEAEAKRKEEDETSVYYDEVFCGDYNKIKPEYKQRLDEAFGESYFSDEVEDELRCRSVLQGYGLDVLGYSEDEVEDGHGYVQRLARRLREQGEKVDYAFPARDVYRHVSKQRQEKKGADVVAVTVGEQVYEDVLRGGDGAAARAEARRVLGDRYGEYEEGMFWAVERARVDRKAVEHVLPVVREAFDAVAGSADNFIEQSTSVQGLLRLKVNAVRMQRAAEAISCLDDSQKEVVWRALEKEKGEESGYMGRVWKSLNRGVFYVAEGLASSYHTGVAMVSAAVGREGGVLGADGFAKGMERASDEEREYVRNMGMLSDFVQNRQRPLSKEEYGWLGNGFLSAAQSAGVTALAFAGAPVAFATAATAYAGQDAKRAFAASPDGDVLLQGGASFVSGVAQQWMESGLAKVAKGVMGVGAGGEFATKVAESLSLSRQAMRMGSGFARGAVRTGTAVGVVTGGEFVQEKAQELPYPILQSLAGVMGGYNDGVDWGEFWKDYVDKDKNLELLGAVLSFGLLGGVGRGAVEVSVQRKLASQEGVLSNFFGFTKQDLREVRMADEVERNGLMADKVRERLLVSYGKERDGVLVSAGNSAGLMRMAEKAGMRPLDMYNAVHEYAKAHNVGVDSVRLVSSKDFDGVKDVLLGVVPADASLDSGSVGGEGMSMVFMGVPKVADFPLVSDVIKAARSGEKGMESGGFVGDGESGSKTGSSGAGEGEVRLDRDLTDGELNEALGMRSGHEVYVDKGGGDDSAMMRVLQRSLVAGANDSLAAFGLAPLGVEVDGDTGKRQFVVTDEEGNRELYGSVYDACDAVWREMEVIDATEVAKTKFETVRWKESGHVGSVANEAVEEMMGYLDDEGMRTEGQRFDVAKRGARMTVARLESECARLKRPLEERMRIWAQQEGAEKGLTGRDAQVFGMNFVKEFRDGTFVSVQRLFAGANPLDVFEERVEGVVAWALRSGEFTKDQFEAALRELEMETGDMYLADGVDRVLAIKEGVARAARANLLGQIRDERLPAILQKWFRRLVLWFGNVMEIKREVERAKRLMSPEVRGKLDAKFLRFLQDVAGLDEDARAERAMKREQDQIEADVRGGREELGEWVKGKLPRPKDVRAKGGELVEELEQIYDAKCRMVKRRAKRRDGSNGREFEQRVTVDAERFFSKEGDMVSVFEAAREAGFEFESAGEMLSAAYDSIVHGRKVYAARGTSEGSVGGVSFSVGSREFRVEGDDSVGLAEHVNDVVEPVEISFEVVDGKQDWRQYFKNYVREFLSGNVFQIGETGFEVFFKGSGTAVNSAAKGVRNQQRAEAGKRLEDVIERAYHLVSMPAEHKEGEGKHRKALVDHSTSFEKFGYPVSVNGKSFVFWFAGHRLKGMPEKQVQFYEFGLAPQNKESADVHAMRAYRAADSEEASPVRALGAYRLEVSSESFPSKLKLGDVLLGVKGKIDGMPEVDVQGDVSFAVGNRDGGSLWDYLAAAATHGTREEVRVMEAMKDRLKVTLAANGFTPEGVYKVSFGAGNIEVDRASSVKEERERVRAVLAVADAVLVGLPKGVRGALSPSALREMRDRALDAKSKRGRMNALGSLVRYTHGVLDRELAKKRLVELERLLVWADTSAGKSRVLKGKMSPEFQSVFAEVRDVMWMKGSELEDAMKHAEVEAEANDDVSDAIREERAQRVAILSTFGGLYERDERGRLLADAVRMDAAVTMASELYTRGRAVRLEYEGERKAHVAFLKGLASDAIGMPERVHANERTESEKSKKAGFLESWESFENLLEGTFGDGEFVKKIFEPIWKARMDINNDEYARKSRYYQALGEGLGVIREREEIHRKIDRQVKFSVRRKVDRVIRELSRAREWGIEVKSSGEFKNQEMTMEEARRIRDGLLDKPEWMGSEEAEAAFESALKERDARYEGRILHLDAITGAKHEHVSVSVAEGRKILSGEKGLPWWGQYQETMGQLKEMVAEVDAKNGEYKFKVEWYEEGVGAKDIDKLTDLEAAYVLQLAGMPGYADNLMAEGFDEAVLELLAQKIDPRAKIVSAVLMEEYAEEYDKYNPLYRELYGIDMPRIDAYAPGVFQPKSEDARVANDPLKGGEGSVGGVSPGGLKQRVVHRSRPRIVSAVNVYWAHAAQMDHWLHFAKPVRDLKAVLLDGVLMDKVAAKFGNGRRDALRMWVDIEENNGCKSAGELLGMRGVIENIMSSTALGALTCNLETCVRQLPAMFASMCELSPKEAWWGLSVLVHPEQLAHVWKSDAIQQRIMLGMSPEMKVALTASRMNPGLVMEALQVGMLPISLTDAALTTVSGGIAYAAERRRCEADGRMSEEEVEANAMAALTRVVRRTAQSSEVEQKSLVELNTKGVGRLLLMFKSDPRVRVGLTIQSFQQLLNGDIGKGRAAWKVLNTWVLYGVLSRFTADAILWMFGNGGDEDDDEGEWWEDYLVSGALGGLAGVFNSADIILALYDSLRGRKAIDFGSATGDVGKVYNSVKYLLSEEMEWGDMVKVINRLGRSFNNTGMLSAVGLGRVGASMQAVGRVAMKTMNLYENWAPLWDEAAKKEAEQLEVVQEVRKVERERDKEERERKGDVFKAVRGIDDEDARWDVYEAHGLSLEESRSVEKRVAQDGMGVVAAGLARLDKKARWDALDKLEVVMSPEDFEALKEELRERGVR